ncbi:MAG TPA: hypothetical protein RMH85_29475 [Polyangiaceae bacterium LLY-WYZ-15_(1-7)]|nr:hypothetical protein [Myxococcales bacterium]MBJ74158.1 hypothetical protein [Sandaracinus sp.]HJK92925.1 hypothetical protein [Polyangiaceae bacterium LLY-WYZ-15_(1-7)]HJL02666.1 hypothetical protein [Polyangiaceae bacterium LLY-WYZ-15_(1-7)]HJL12648.1 hypothetical protein [Polyangiaceae bacterium LLY-WYZ-15_(1-7)]
MRRAALALLALAACGGGAEGPPDLRFHTPKATVDTLLDVYGLGEGVSQGEVRRRIRIGRTFHLNDPETRDACFADWGEPWDEGLAGYVLGSLAPLKDDLTITLTEETAHVHATGEDGRRIRPVVLRQEDDGAWKIVLRESVPDDVRRRIRESWEAQQRKEEGG